VADCASEHGDLDDHQGNPATVDQGLVLGVTQRLCVNPTRDDLIDAQSDQRRDNPVDHERSNTSPEACD
jgi:hypothetical protein